jgi:20S proteasome alpha/beta subunit
MTTIAYRDGVLASDSRFIVNGWKQPYPAKKLFRMNDGTVCAVTGDYAVSVALVRWLDSDQKEASPSLGEGGRVIHLIRDGEITVYEMSGSFEVRAEFAAWGSGSPAAHAAFHMGADAVKAVEIASLVDDGTGAPFCFMRCED